MTPQLELNVPQANFLNLPHKYKAYVAGFGSGKTFVGCVGICMHFWQWPGISQGYFAPTYPQIRDIFYPTMEEVAYAMGLRIKVKQGDHEVEVYEGRLYRGTVICRSMEKPETIVGFKIGHALIDELDVMPMKKAETAWRKIIARMRYNVPGLLNGIDVTTTPEGFKFVYQQFVKALRDKPELAALYGLIQASTFDNELNLPADYIPSLLASYPPALIDAYLRGKFTNLASGSVYPDFDRVKNRSTQIILPGEPLQVGLDFNVQNMTACINVVREGLPLTLAERVKVRDTPAMAKILKEDFKDKGHQVKIYPDASGQNTSSKNASESDLSILRAAGFQIEVDHANPAVKDRVNAYNAMILNADGVRRWKINTDLCPTTTEALEQQVWGADGQPDKKSGHDHACFTGDTNVLTRGGMYRFDELPASGEVMGPSGNWVRYVGAGKTGSKSTVKITIANGYVIECSQDHLFLVRSGEWIQAKDLAGHECMLSVIPAKNSKADGITFAESIFKTPPQRGRSGFTALFGSSSTVQSPMAITYTMSTETAPTISRRTYFASRVKSIFGSTALSVLRRLRRWGERTNLAPKLGMAQMLEKNGMPSSISGQSQLYGQHIQQAAHAAGGNSRQAAQSKTARLSSAQKHVRHTLGGRVALTTLLESVKSAECRSPQINTANGSLVVDVSPQGVREVYCLTVPDIGCFKLDAGSPIVSNCDANGYFIVKRYPVVKRTARSGELGI